MKKATITVLVLIALLAVATVFANAQMYSSQALYNKDSPGASPYKEMMQKEMSSLLELQGKYSKGQVTGEQYRIGMESHCSSMTEIHREFLFSNVAIFR